MKLLVWGIWLVGLIVALSWAYGIRRSQRLGQPSTYGGAAATFYFVLSLMLVPILGISPLHLLWAFPLAWLMGAISIGFPLLRVPGGWMIRICAIGLDPEEIHRKRLLRSKLERRLEELESAGYSVQEAKQVVVDEYGDKLRDLFR